MKTRDLAKIRMSVPSLTSELSRFCSHSNRLKQIFAETKKCFSDINVSGRFDGNQIVSAELLKEEELAITSVIEYPPTFVIFGQSPYAKSRIVNELFNKDVFPSLEEDSDIRLRMVRFYHGDKNTVCLTLPDDFDLVDNLEAYNGPWVTIPQSDLEVPSKSSSDEASGLAVMEVTQNHPLLRYGVQVIVSPSHQPDQFEEVVNKCIEYATPILIFGFTSDRLSEQDVVELHQLSRLTNLEPILFVRVPPPGSRTVDTDPPDGAPRGPHSAAQHAAQHAAQLAAQQHYSNTLLMASTPPSGSHFPEDAGLWPPHHQSAPSPGAFQVGCGSSSCPVSLGFATSAPSPPPPAAPAPLPLSPAPSSSPTSPASPLTPSSPPPRAATIDSNGNNSSGSFNIISNVTTSTKNNSSSISNRRGSGSPNCPVEDQTPSGRRASQTAHQACCVHEQLRRLGYVRSPEPGAPEAAPSGPECASSAQWQQVKRQHLSTESHLLERFPDLQSRLARFTRRTLQTYLVNAATVLNNSHTRCLNMFILSAFDMARDMLITPRKLEFAREKEEELYKSLLGISVSKLDEIKELIATTIDVIGTCIVAEAGQFEFIGIEVSESGQVSSTREVQACTEQIREMVLGRLNHAVAGKLVSSVDILRDSYTGTLTRCLESLETLDRDSPEEAKTTDALKQILNAAYTVEITVRSSSSFIKNLLEKMKQLVQSMPWKAPPVIGREWKEKVAEEMLSNLSESRLARSISAQIKERLNKSHEQFSNALRQLEMRHTGRLDKIEEHRLKLRKVHAPRLAKMALESTSLRDVTLFGMPHMGREIGRGQYGVVYSCDSWGSHSPCAIKSVVPPDDKHWNDLALEFFYTKNIPEHPRIVMLRGSVIDYMYGGGTSPAVLLIMDRLQRDLYTAIKQGLDWLGRLQVSIDVVEGLRYLHSQGLVHRDVKLKNVLLDKDNRGRITDLGFCKPEAMMSGSIVGTPIHMAPELFTGHYDNSVDVYAFGILFWYVCAGHVRLPNAFEQCANKDQLWQSVKKGLRPEQPVSCSEDCWTLMRGCWEGDPGRRPFFGDVEVTLKSIVEKYKRKVGSKASSSDKRSRGQSPRHKSSQHRSNQIPSAR